MIYTSSLHDNNVGIIQVNLLTENPKQSDRKIKNPNLQVWNT